MPHAAGRTQSSQGSRENRDNQLDDSLPGFLILRHRLLNFRFGLSPDPSLVARGVYTCHADWKLNNSAWRRSIYSPPLRRGWGWVCLYGSGSSSSISLSVTNSTFSSSFFSSLAGRKRILRRYTAEAPPASSSPTSPAWADTENLKIPRPGT